jgi:hypothetical protein
MRKKHFLAALDPGKTNEADVYKYMEDLLDAPVMDLHAPLEWYKYLSLGLDPQKNIEGKRKHFIENIF